MCLDQQVVASSEFLSYLLPGGCCFSCFSCLRVTRVVCDSCLSAMTQDCLQVAGGPPVCSGRGRSNAGAAAPPCAAAAGVHTAMPAPFSLSRKCNRGSLCAPNLQFWVNGFLHLSQVSEFLLGFSGQSFHMQPLLGPVLRCKLTGQCHSGRAERTDCGPSRRCRASRDEVQALAAKARRAEKRRKRLQATMEGFTEAAQQPILTHGQYPIPHSILS